MDGHQLLQLLHSPKHSNATSHDGFFPLDLAKDEFLSSFSFLLQVCWFINGRQTKGFAIIYMVCIYSESLNKVLRSDYECCFGVFGRIWLVVFSEEFLKISIK